VKKLEINDLIQIAGMLGIIGSLVFVGLQMKQTQTIALGEQIQARNQMLLDSQLILLGGEHIGRDLIDKANIAALNPETLSEEVSSVWRQLISVRGVTIQNAFQQYELGLLPEDVWQQADQRISLHWNNCHIRPIWTTVVIPTFLDYLNSFPEDCLSNFD
jgi:hypothetical protein